MLLRFTLNNYQKGACLRLLGDRVESLMTIGNNKHILVCDASSENEKKMIEKILGKKSVVLK